MTDHRLSVNGITETVTTAFTTIKLVINLILNSDHM